MKVTATIAPTKAIDIHTDVRVDDGLDDKSPPEIAL